MKIENQVCALDQAKRLKDLGISEFATYCFWPPNPFHPEGYHLENSLASPAQDAEAFYAYNAAELGEMLPRECYTMLELGEKMHVWHCGTDNEEVLFPADTEAQAKADLLIWLLEKGKLNPETVNVALAAA